MHGWTCWCRNILRNCKYSIYIKDLCVALKIYVLKSLAMYNIYSNKTNIQLLKETNILVLSRVFCFVLMLAILRFVVLGIRSRHRLKRDYNNILLKVYVIVLFLCLGRV